MSQRVRETEHIVREGTQGQTKTTHGQRKTGQTEMGQTETGQIKESDIHGTVRQRRSDRGGVVRESERDGTESDKNGQSQRTDRVGQRRNSH